METIKLQYQLAYQIVKSANACGWQRSFWGYRRIIGGESHWFKMNGFKNCWVSEVPPIQLTYEDIPTRTMNPLYRRMPMGRPRLWDTTREERMGPECTQWHRENEQRIQELIEKYGETK